MKSRSGHSRKVVGVAEFIPLGLSCSWFLGLTKVIMVWFFERYFADLCSKQICHWLENVRIEAIIFFRNMDFQQTMFASSAFFAKIDLKVYRKPGMYIHLRGMLLRSVTPMYTCIDTWS